MVSLLVIQKFGRTEVHSIECAEWTMGQRYDVVWCEAAADAMGDPATTYFYPCVSVTDSEPSEPRSEPNEDDGRPKLSRPLPFALDDHDAVIYEACIGKKLVWWNGLSRTMDEAHLYPDGRDPKTGAKYNKQTKVHSNGNGRRMITFCAVNGGFRTVALDMLLAVR